MRTSGDQYARHCSLHFADLQPLYQGVKMLTHHALKKFNRHSGLTKTP
jgi:hypothetical protein